MPHSAGGPNGCVSSALRSQKRSRGLWVGTYRRNLDQSNIFRTTSRCKCSDGSVVNRFKIIARAILQCTRTVHDGRKLTDNFTPLGIFTKCTDIVFNPGNSRQHSPCHLHVSAKSRDAIAFRDQPHRNAVTNKAVGTNHENIVCLGIHAARSMITSSSNSISGSADISCTAEIQQVWAPCGPKHLQHGPPGQITPSVRAGALSEAIPQTQGLRLRSCKKKLRSAPGPERTFHRPLRSCACVPACGHSRQR